MKVCGDPGGMARKAKNEKPSLGLCAQKRAKRDQGWEFYMSPYFAPLSLQSQGQARRIPGEMKKADHVSLTCISGDDDNRHVGVLLVDGVPCLQHCLAVQAHLHTRDICLLITHASSAAVQYVCTPHY